MPDFIHNDATTALSDEITAGIAGLPDITVLVEARLRYAETRQRQLVEGGAWRVRYEDPATEDEKEHGALARETAKLRDVLAILQSLPI